MAYASKGARNRVSGHESPVRNRWSSTGHRHLTLELRCAGFGAHCQSIHGLQLGEVASYDARMLFKNDRFGSVAALQTHNSPMLALGWLAAANGHKQAKRIRWWYAVACHIMLVAFLGENRNGKVKLG
jgi:hypothetical protein